MHRMRTVHTRPDRRTHRQTDRRTDEHHGNSANKRIVNVLKSVYLSLRKVKVKRITVVKIGMYYRNGDGVGCFEVKVGTNAA